MKYAMLALGFLASGLFAQPPTFETASIKPAPADSQCGNGSLIGPMPGGGLRVECLPLKNILMWAYDIQDYQLSGGPSWMANERWSILAKPAASEKAPDGPVEYEKMNDPQRARYMDLVRQRLRALLVDRFQLVLRRETRDETVYVLTAAKKGPKLKPSADPSAPAFIQGGRGKIVSRGAQMTALAQYLAINVRRPVTDSTGLFGHYDFTLQWTPDQTPNASSAAETAADTTGPSLFTAIEEQLGLRLESRKAPVETLIVERVERPSEN